MRRAIVIRAAALTAGCAVFAFVAGIASDGTGPGMLVIAGAGIALAAAAAGYLVFHPVQATVRETGDAARRIARGDLGGAVPAVPASRGPASGLATSFNAMTRRLDQLFEEVDAERARRDAMLEASTDGVLALASDTSVRLANTAAGRLLGANPDQLLDRPLIESARDYELDQLVRAVSGTRTPATAVIVYGPERIPLRAAALPITGGGEWTVLLLLTDLTDVNRVDQVRRDFVSNVSHELRTPLASIRALAETIEAGDVEPGEETAEFAERITQQVDRLATLVNELLELSRIESGAIELQPVAVDVAHVVREAAGLLRARSDRAGVMVEIPEGGPTVEADHDSLFRVVSNLLDNAIKFSPRGATVRIEAEEYDDMIALTVSDEGPGIPAADLGRVFERFYKGDTSRGSMGVGLGLAIVKHTVRSHGGAVEAQNRPGGGARFTVRLPRHFAGPRAPRDR